MKRGFVDYIIIILVMSILIMLFFLIFKNMGPSQESSARINITGCQTKESCIEYCSKPENNQKCANFVLRKEETKIFFPFFPGDCKNKDECDKYCRENEEECAYYISYMAKAIENLFDKNYSDIIIPANKSKEEILFYKIGNSHFFDSHINKEFENFKEMGINSYSFWVEVSYVLGDVAYNIDNTKYGIKTWPGHFEGWESRAAYLIGLTHLNKLKFIYFVSPTDWDSWEAPQYPESVSKDLVDDWIKNYTQPVRIVSQFAQSVDVDILVIGANPAIVKVDREASNEYLNSVYEKLLQEMLKEARKWYKGEIGFDFGNDVSGTILEFKEVPEIGKFDYVFFATSAKPLDDSDPFKWTDRTLKTIEEARKIVEKNSAKGVILEYEFGETDLPVIYGECKSVQQYSVETRKMLYNDLINKTKKYVLGYMPITTPLFACDYKTLLEVAKEQYKRL